MSIHKLRPNFTFTEDRLQELRAIVPEAFVEGKVNWETLREALGEFLEDESDSSETFGLSWPGKREARILASKPSKGNLVPLEGDQTSHNTERHVFIEGENLEVLKLLSKSYAGKVKLIFIDPPYNTGSDFIYNDDYTEPLESYLKKSGQADDEGLLVSNPKSSGRFHSGWLNMMFPRLILARSLLRSDGSIFITVDDNEQPHLRLLMDEIFGPENFVANIVWQAKDTPGNDSKGISATHNYVVCYRRSEDFQINLLPRTQKQLDNYKNPDNDERGPWLGTPLTRSEFRPRDYYALVNPNGDEVWPTPGSSWRRPREVIMALEQDNRIWWGKNGDSQFPFIKQFLSEVKSGVVPTTWWDYRFAGSTRRARRETRDVFGGIRGFDTPKPLDLLEKILDIGMGSEGIVLDFFAGSGTTAHAVLKKNYGDGGKRKFITVQIPEVLKEPIVLDSGHRLNTIADIGRERILRVINDLKKEDERTLPVSASSLELSLYFLGRSNFVSWQEVSTGNVEQLQVRFDLAETPLLEDWSPESLRTELLLIEGFPLDSIVKPLRQFVDNDVAEITSTCCQHRLIICLDSTISDGTIQLLQLADTDVFVCLDSALTNQNKIRLADICNLHVI